MVAKKRPKPVAPRKRAAPATKKVAKKAPPRKKKRTSSKASRAGGSKARKARLGALRSAFKEALSLTQKNSDAPSVGSTSSKSVFGKA